MTPLEVKNNLSQMQKCSTALMLSLAKHNKAINALVIAIDSGNEDDFAASVSALGKSSGSVADMLEAYCTSAAFFLRGEEYD